MRKVALFSLAMVLGNLSATRADACRLWDWIRGQRSGQSAAASLLAPATGVGYSALRPYTVQRVLVGYAPRTTYQTTWVAAPVTYYRPLTTMDPTRSTLTTALQPCTGYQWRQQRVPVTSYRPIYSTVAVPTRAPTVPLVGQPSAAFPGLAPPLTRAPEGLQVTPYGPTYPTPALTAPAVTAPAIAPRAADTAPALDAAQTASPARTSRCQSRSASRAAPQRENTPLWWSGHGLASHSKSESSGGSRGHLPATGVVFSTGAKSDLDPRTERPLCTHCMEPVGAGKHEFSGSRRIAGPGSEEAAGGRNGMAQRAVDSAKMNAPRL